MKLLLIQFRTDQSAPHEQRCVKVHAELEDHHLHVVNPLTHPTNVEHIARESFDGVMIGGSGEFNISAPTAELRQALDLVKPLIDQALATDQPLLGMCFGHQLLGAHLGGCVGVHPDGPRTGTFRIRLTDEGRADPIKSGLPHEFEAQHGHKDVVTKLPPGAVVLSTSDHDPHASFRYGANTYSIQYHPELDQDDILYRVLELYPSYMAGKTEEEVRAVFRPTPHAPQLLRNFRRLVEQRLAHS